MPEQIPARTWKPSRYFCPHCGQDAVEQDDMRDSTHGFTLCCVSCATVFSLCRYVVNDYATVREIQNQPHGVIDV